MRRINEAQYTRKVRKGARACAASAALHLRSTAECGPRLLGGCSQ